MFFATSIMRTTCPLLVTCCVMLWATLALAQDPQDVHVLSYGGIDSVATYRLSPSNEVVRQADVNVRAAQSPDRVEITDLKVLPDGTFLLSNYSDQGVVAFDPATRQNTALWPQELSGLNVESASVAAYNPVGKVNRVLFAESQTSQLFIYDVLTQRLLFGTSLLLPGARATPVQSIVMPQGRFVVALNWPTLGASGIDIYQLGDEGTTITRLVNTPTEGRVNKEIVVPELVDIRDLTALDENTLVVTTRFEVLAIDLEGNLLWSIQTVDDPEVSGEFSSTTLLASGDLAIATFEPGLWTSAHPNHKIHWYDLPMPGQATKRLGSSTALDAAPRRVRAALSTGGTGTLNYTAGLLDIAQGNLSEIESDPALNIDPAKINEGARIVLKHTLTNRGSLSVFAESVLWLATQGSECMPGGVPPKPVYEQRSVLFEPGVPLNVEESFIPPLAPGTWCIYVELKDAEGARLAQFDQGVTLEIAAKSGAATKQVPKSDLNLQVTDPNNPKDPGEDFTPDEVLTTPNPGDQQYGGAGDRGCGCAHSASAPSGGFVVLMLGLLGLLGRRQRRLR